jgi:hypothetical protein
MADPVPLHDLRAQVRATQEAAERLMGSGVPPRGWDVPRADAGAFSEEVQALAGLLSALREIVPPELRDQLTDLVRQLLLVLRALIDWLVARIEQEVEATRAGSVRTAEDIPIA